MKNPPLALSLLLLPSLCFGSGYEFEGVGARQVGRAGAATADADDWTAVYWNPAGLAAGSRRPQAGLELFGGRAYSKDGNSLSSLPGLGAVFARDKLSSSFLLGAAGGSIPLGERLALGFGLYTPILQGLDFSDANAGGTALDYQGSLGIVTANLSLGWSPFPGFSLGSGLNILYGKLAARTRLHIPSYDDVTSDLSGQGWGVEGVLGARYDPDPKLSFGAVLRTGADVDIQGTAVSTSRLSPAENSNFSFILKHPPTSAFGAAWRPSPSWTLSADLSQTWWRSFRNDVYFFKPGTLLTNRANSFDWRDTWKLRLGAESRLGERLSLLGGWSYDRFAVDTASLDFAATVDVPMHRLYAGVKRSWTKSLETTLAGVYGAGRRNEQGIEYRLSGFQLMLGTRLLY